LATLHCDVPIRVELSDLAIEEPDKQRLTALFQEFEFRRLLAEMNSPWDSPSSSETPTDTGVYETVRTAKQLEEVLRALRKAKTFCLDTETTALNPGGTPLAS
jgi:DNA polymerase-1